MRPIPIIIIVLLVMTVIALSGWFILKPATNHVVQQDPVIDTENNLVAQNQNTATPSINNEKVTEEDNPYLDEVVKAQILQVADQYREASKYPHFSQPITNPESLALPIPFDSTEVETPFPEPGLDEPIRLQLATEQYQYFQGDIIRARLRISGTQVGQFLAAQGQISSNQTNTPLVAQFQEAGQPGEFFAEFDSSLLATTPVSPELLLKVTVTVDDEKLFTTLGFRFDQAPATAVAVSYTQVDGAFLHIGVQYNVRQAGYYFAQGILTDANSGQPLVRLQSEGRMETGSGLQVFRAHIQALKAVGSQGPYLLTNISGYRGAGRGDQFDLPTNTIQPNFNVPGYAFEQYQDEDYSDPEAAERLAFLEQLGSIEASTDNPTESSEK